MAETPLALLGWVYDDETNRIVAKFIEAVPVDHPDPVNFRGEQHFTIEINPVVAETEFIPVPPYVAPPPVVTPEPTPEPPPEAAPDPEVPDGPQEG